MALNRNATSWGRRRMVVYLSAACAALLLCGTASATITLSTTTRGGTSATATGAAVDNCRAPCGIVIDAGSGTTTTHSTGSAEQIGIRFAEKKITNCDYTHNGGTLPTITCNNSPNLNSFTTFSWELTTVSTSGGSDWTEGSDGINEFFHDGGTEVHGKPIGVRIAGSDATEGTCCALGAGQWGWCNPFDCNAADVNANRVMVRLSDDTDPDDVGNPTGTVKVIYGDGEYIEVQHSTWNSGNPTYIYVNDKTDDDTIVLAAAPSGASGDITNDSVTVFQAVNPWTDLRYNYSVTCTGAVCIEDISNGDQRPGLATTAIDETVGQGPMWAFVFAEGFDSDVAGAGGATITVTVNDDANGDTEDSQTIAVDEAAWAGTDYYISAAGNDTTGDGSIGNPWRTWEKLANELRTVAGGTAKRGFLNRGDTFTVATSLTQWSNETDDVLFTAYGSGALPIVTAGASLNIWDTANTCANIRMKDINFVRTAGTRVFAANGNTSVYMNLTFDYASVTNTGDTVQRGLNSGRYNDNIIWNCIINNTGADVDYALYDSNPSTAGQRAPVVGTKITHAGDIAAYRTYRNHDNFMAYTEIVRNDTIQAVNHNLRIYGGPGDTAYVYLFGLYLHGVGGNEAYIAIQEDGTGEIENVLIDSCYINGTNAASSGNAIRFDSAEASDAKIQNCVANGVLRFAESFTNTTVNEARFFSNSVYTAWTGAKEFVGNATTNSWRNLKVINNAVLATSNHTSTLLVDGSGTLNRLNSTQITNNVWSMGTTNEMALTESVTYDAPANWTAATGKGAQVDLETSPIFALPASSDFRLCTAAGTPDASCAGASPCIDAGYDLPTVYYDYSGAVRNSDDVGAWDDDSAGMDMGAGPPVGSATLLGVGR